MTRPNEIIDVHAHIFPDDLAVRAADNVVNYYGLTREGDGTKRKLLEGGTNFDSARFVISSATLKPAHMRAANDFLLDSADSDKRLIPLGSFHPDGDKDEIIAELERIKARGAKGIKLHPDFQRFPIDREDVFVLYSACAQLGLPVLFHVGDRNSDLSAPKRLLKVIDKLPDLIAIAAHLCGYDAWNEAEEFLIGADVYTDTSDSQLWLDNERVYSLIEKHGVDRVMFGSDYPLSTTESAFLKFEELGFDDRTKAKIYSGNAKRLFNLD